ncbi:MAG: ribonuclease E/G [Lachnospiraceae bacterium]
MSRHIDGISHISREHEIYQTNTEQNKVILTRNHGILYAFLLENGRICKVAREEEQAYPIGTVLIGKVVNVLKETEGAFIRLDSKNTMAYLPVTGQELSHIRIINRKPDGRILQNDDVIIQIRKEPQKTKPYLVSGMLELSGEYLALHDGSGQVHVSKKIEQSHKKDYLKYAFQWKEANIAESNMEEENVDIVFRTNAMFADRDDIHQEYINLISQFKNIDLLGRTRTVYSILYRTDLFYIEMIRNLDYSKEYEIITDCKDVLEHLEHHNIHSRLYQDEQISLSKIYSLKTRLQELSGKKVYMKSGAYLVIEPTEALISIDVNSGKAQKNVDHETYSLQINLEAAKEVAYQMKVRNLSGMILIDFINMNRAESKKELIDVLCSEISKDTVTTKFIDFTKLGLAELTRKRMEKPLAYVLRDWE